MDLVHLGSIYVPEGYRITVTVFPGGPWDCLVTYGTSEKPWTVMVIPNAPFAFDLTEGGYVLVHFGPVNNPTSWTKLTLCNGALVKGPQVGNISIELA